MAKYSVVIKHVKTGNKTVIKYETDSTQKEIEFLWSEGNYGCDCNLAIFFNDKEGTDYCEDTCGDQERFKVVSIDYHS